MKPPALHLHYHYKQPQPLKIRFGRGWDGLYFFEIIVDASFGVGYVFSDKMHGGKDWEQYMKYLTELPRPLRMKEIVKLIQQAIKQIETVGALYGGVEKFTTKRLFHAYPKQFLL